MICFPFHWSFLSTHVSVPTCMQEYRSGLPCCPPGDLPNPGIERRSPSFLVDSLPPEPPGKPKNTGVGSQSLPQGIFLTQELNWGLQYCRQIFYQLSHQGSPRILNPADLPDPGIKLGSPALQADSLSTELLGKPHKCILWCICKSVMDGANHLLAVEMILAFYFSKYKL